VISDYAFFRAKLFPVLPFLIYQASMVRKKRPMPPAVSERVVFGNGLKKILLLGESTVAGVGASSPEFSIAGHLATLLGPNYEVQSLGKTGLRAAQVFSSFESELSGSNGPFDGILIFLGANDCFRLTHPLDFNSQLEALITGLKLRYSPNWIYLADIPPVHLFPAFPSLLRSFLKSQRKFLQQEMIRLSTADHQLIFNRISLTLSPEFFSTDGVHPSDIGYEKITEFAMEGIKKRLKA